MLSRNLNICALFIVGALSSTSLQAQFPPYHIEKKPSVEVNLEVLRSLAPDGRYNAVQRYQQHVPSIMNSLHGKSRPSGPKRRPSARKPDATQSQFERVDDYSQSSLEIVAPPRPMRRHVDAPQPRLKPMRKPPEEITRQIGEEVKAALAQAETEAELEAQTEQTVSTTPVTVKEDPAKNNDSAQQNAESGRKLAPIFERPQLGVPKDTLPPLPPLADGAIKPELPWLGEEDMPPLSPPKMAPPPDMPMPEPIAIVPSEDENAQEDANRNLSAPPRDLMAMPIPTEMEPLDPLPPAPALPMDMMDIPDLPDMPQMQPPRPAAVAAPAINRPAPESEPEADGDFALPPLPKAARDWLKSDTAPAPAPAPNPVKTQPKAERSFPDIKKIEAKKPPAPVKKPAKAAAVQAPPIKAAPVKAAPPPLPAPTPAPAPAIPRPEVKPPQPAAKAPAPEKVKTTRALPQPQPEPQPSQDDMLDNFTMPGFEPPVAAPAAPTYAPAMRELPSAASPGAAQQEAPQQGSQLVPPAQEEKKSLLEGVSSSFRNLLTSPDTSKEVPAAKAPAAAPAKMPEIIRTPHQQGQQDIRPATLPEPERQSSLPAVPKMDGNMDKFNERPQADEVTANSNKKALPSLNLLQEKPVKSDGPASTNNGLPSMQALKEDNAEFLPLPEMDKNAVSLANDFELIEQNNKPVAQAQKNMELAALPSKQQPASTTQSSGDSLQEFAVDYGADDTDVPDSVKSKLLKLAAKLKGRPMDRVIVTAYASGKPEEKKAANMISLSRALSLRAFLIDAGIDMDRIIVKAKGLDNPDGPVDRADLRVE
jgi:outer membrane protein OmpA-like peptidoglycan-associated protein